MRVKSFIGLVFIGSSLFAAEPLVVRENIETRILGTTEGKFEEVKKEASKNCEGWLKGSVFHSYQTNILLGSQCTRPKIEKTFEEKKSWECSTQVHPVTGERIEYRGYEHRDVHVGFRGKSIGTRTLKLPEATEFIEEELASESFMGTAAREKAFNDYKVVCAEWLNESKSKFGTKSVFLGCRGAKDDTLKFVSKDGVSRFESKAVVILEKNTDSVQNLDNHSCSASGEPGCNISCSDEQEAYCLNGVTSSGPNDPGVPGLCQCR